MKLNQKKLYGGEKRRRVFKTKHTKKHSKKPKENCQQLFLADYFFNSVCKTKQVVIICLYPHMLTSWVLYLKVTEKKQVYNARNPMLLHSFLNSSQFTAVTVHIHLINHICYVLTKNTPKLHKLPIWKKKIFSCSID